MPRQTKEEKIKQLRASIRRDKQRKAKERLLSKSNDDKMLNEELNSFVSKFRKLYLSGKPMRFKDWLIKVEDLIDELK